MGQRFGFSLTESLLAEVAGVRQWDLHFDVGAMIRAAGAVAPVTERLGVGAPKPHLAGFSYCHVSALGCEVVFPRENPEPWVGPIIRAPADIDALAEPDDYLSAGVVPQRLALAAELKKRCPDASEHIGHDFEGPVTTAVLLMGQDFFTLPLEDPARAHKLMDFCVRSSLNYCRVLRERQGRAFGGGPAGIPDDFAGIFGPEQFSKFAAPYWERMYEGLGATRRSLHSELLREEHLPFLEQVKIDEFDPSVDPYLPPETLKRSCRVPFTLRMWPSEVMSCSAEELVRMYRHRASFHPTVITFSLARLAEEEKVAALLRVARELT